ncbi:unnamed protein product [Absidia cylindrospora]
MNPDFICYPNVTEMENSSSFCHVKTYESRHAPPSDNVQRTHKSFQATSPPPFSFKFVPRSTSNRIAETPSSGNFANQSSLTQPSTFKHTPKPSTDLTSISGSTFQQPFYATNAPHPLFNINHRPNKSVNVSPQLSNATPDTSPPQLSLFDDFDAIHHMTAFSSNLGNTESIQDLNQATATTPHVDIDLTVQEPSSDTKEYYFMDDDQKRQQPLRSSMDENTGAESNIDVEEYDNQQQLPMDAVTSVMEFAHIIQSCSQAMQQCGDGIQKLLHLKEIHAQQNQSVELVEINGILEARSKLVESKLQSSKNAIKQLAKQDTLYQCRKQLNLDLIRAMEPDIKWMIDHANERELNDELIQKRQRMIDLGQVDIRNQRKTCIKKETRRCEEVAATNHHFITQCNDLKTQLIGISSR